MKIYGKENLINIIDNYINIKQDLVIIITESQEDSLDLVQIISQRKNVRQIFNVPGICSLFQFFTFNGKTYPKIEIIFLKEEHRNEHIIKNTKNGVIVLEYYNEDKTWTEEDEKQLKYLEEKKQKTLQNTRNKEVLQNLANKVAGGIIVKFDYSIEYTLDKYIKHSIQLVEVIK